MKLNCIHRLLNSTRKSPLFQIVFLTALLITWTGLAVYGQVDTLDTGATIDTLQQPVQDTIPQDSLLNRPYEPSSQPVYEPKDRFGDPFSFSEETSPSPLLLEDPSQLEMDVEIDTALNYTIYEKIGDLNYRPTTTMSFEEFSQLQQEQMIKSYWQEQSAALDGESAVSGRGLIPPIYTTPLFDRLFGGSYVDIRPNGFVTLDFGVRAQRIDNPQIPIRQQRTVNFEFDQQISLNVVGKVGDKLAITANFDNNNSFDFQNDIKVEYTGYEHEIIKKIELGTVSLPVSNSLLSGSQSLFGLKTQLQFGKLMVTSVATIQRGQTDAVEIEGGTQSREFTIKASDYDENRHFFLGHFFRDNYEKWLQGIPQILSGLNITRVEVYVMNRNNDTETQRNFVSFMDLGEGRRIYRKDNDKVGPGSPSSPTANNANSLFVELQNTQGTRDVNQVSSILENEFSFENSVDYVKITSARKLDEREYNFNSELGYISLFRKLQNDEVLAVAFEYTYNGQRYKVGELTEDYQNRPDNEVIFLKMLRPNKINTSVPTWDLMMKNIYSLNASQVNQEGFEFRVVYRDDQTGVDNPSLHEGANTRDQPLIRLLGLDNLNPNNDPQPDGNFDFVEGITINTELGNVIFPVLEPFGQALDTLFTDAEQNLVNKYVYDELYETTKAEAELETTKNKFFLVGRYTAGSSSEILLPGINIAEGSVMVYAGNTPLTEGTEYTVDYNLGKVNIINEGILSSGKKIRITYEKADLFNFQTRSFFGTRLEYQFNDDFNLGATVLHLNERPIISRVSIGDEPTKNTQYGFDLNFRKDSRFLTKMVDFLPLLQTKETSTITINAEYAQLIPGTSNVVDGEGASYIDDFENTITPFNMGGWQNWQLAATPETEDNRFDLQSQAGNRLGLGYKRAKVSWYVVDNSAFYTSNGLGIRPDNIPRPVENHYERSIIPQEIFTQQDQQVINTALPVFDVAYFPEERGPYNYNPNLISDGRLQNPETNWGGITRAITSDVDFDKTNVEYLEFWLLDPFIQGENGRVQDGVNNTNNTTGGELVFNLGSVSEDLIVDEQHGFENGLPDDGSDDKVNVTEWGRVTQRQFLTNAFDNSSEARENQDVGMDGVKNEEEPEFFEQDYISKLNVSAEARQSILDDPSADNFEYYLGDNLDARNAQIVERYKNFNNHEGNSPIDAGSNLRYTPSGSQTPDNEDLNRDNTISDLEEYYEYRINLQPAQLRVGQNNIVDVVEPTTGAPKWYLFRIPIREPDRIQGNIQGFKSIRFARMYLTGWEQPVVLRFVKFQLVGSQWRKFEGNLFDKGLFELPEPYDAGFNISVVNIEENGQAAEGGSPYVLPPGINRDRDNTSAIERRVNEQSIQLCVDDLRDKDARAVYKNMTLDLINYGRIKMFLHAESQTARDSTVTAFMRLGTDFNENYYEVEVPLVMSPPGDGTPEVVWPEENEIDVALNDLYAVKSARNRINRPINLPYTEQRGKHRITVVGRPELSTVQTVMIGIRNPDSPDRAPQSVCIWANELRVTDFDRTKGWAANARINTKLADFGNVTASARRLTYGFGGVQSRISERSREDITEYDVSGSFELGKLLPDKLGLQVPMYASYERGESVPQFDPKEPDIPLEATLDAISDPQERNNYLDIATDQITRRSLNFTNVRKIKTGDSPSMFYDLSNFSFSYAYSDVEQSNFNTAQYLQRVIRGGVSYNYTFPTINIAPFSGIQSPWLGLIRDINFSPLPTSFSASADLNRSFFKTVYRDANLNPLINDANYQKSFTFNRQYDLRWNLTTNLSLDYSSRANAIIDEPLGDLNTESKRDTVWNNLKKFGRMKNFDQQVGATYTVPFDRLPITDWVKADVRYTAGYTWRAGAFSLDPDVPSQADVLGNVIENNRDRSLNGQLDFVSLYNKVRILKEINSPPPRRRGAATPTQNQNEEEVEEAPKENKFVKGVLRLLMSLRTVSMTYNINEGTRLPGFMRRAYLFGLDSGFNAPGIPFLLGSQDPGIRTTAANNGWLTRDSTLTTPFSQIATNNLNIRADLEPARDFRIQLDVKKSKTGMYQEIYRYVDSLGMHTPLNPSRNGTYSISYFTLPTAFDKLDANNISEAFSNFEAYRNPIRDRLTAGNSDNDGEYDLNSQDVLIPAFIAAYTGKTPDEVKLSPFPKFPLPNWRVDYTGLPNLIPTLSDVFQSISITHAYTSTYDVSNFSNSLAYSNTDLLQLNNNIENYNPITATEVNEENNLYIPTFIIQQVAITERFNPLVGVNLRTKNRFTARAEYRLERSLALQLSNTQITELRSRDFAVEVGFTKSEFKLPFRVQGRTVVLENDLTFRLNVAIKDMETIQRKIDDESIITNGNLNFQLRPTISYVLNDQLQLQYYFTRTVNDPKVTNSFKRTTTESGIQIRFNLAQ